MNDYKLLTEHNEKELAFLDIEEFFNFVDSKYYIVKIDTNRYMLADKYKRCIASDKIYTQLELRAVFQKKPCDIGYEKCESILNSLSSDILSTEKHLIAETFAVIFHDYNMSDEQIREINTKFEDITFYNKERK